MLGLMMHKDLTVGSLIDHAAQYHSNQPIISIGTDRLKTTTTWKQVDLEARKLASALARFGLKRGDVCGTIAWNNHHHLQVYFGVSSSGLVCHTINPRLSPENLTYILNHAEDRVLFVDQTFLPLVARIGDQLTTVQRVVVFGSGDISADIGGLPVVSYDDFVAAGDPGFTWPEVAEESASSLCYTSGTTGHPKGVLYSHRSTVLHTMFGNQPDFLNISRYDTVLPVVPMFHVNAWGVPYIAAASGCKLVLPGPGLDGASLMQLMIDEKVSLALGVPTIWEGLLDALETNKQKLPHLTRTIVGGSACPPSMFDRFKDLYDVDVIHAWGMTETSPLGTLNRPRCADSGPGETEEQIKQRFSQGRPPFGVALSVGDGLGDAGALSIKGHWVVERYFKSRVPAIKDGWFDTGDIATLDEEGFMTIVDRSKDLIKSGGEWISSVALENAIMQNRHVAAVAVIGCEHEKWGERPVAIVVPRDNEEISELALMSFISNRVERLEIPDVLVFVDELPMGATGKVLKHKLRKKFGKILKGSRIQVKKAYEAFV